MRLPLPARWRCRSSPLMPGICTSVIRQAAARQAGEARNSSAEAKVATPRSSDASRLLSASRTASSSSTTATVGVWEQVMAGNCSFRQVRESYTNVCRFTAICAAQEARPCAQGRPASPPHLAHGLPAIELHGDLAETELVRDLLVHQAARHQGHDLALARASAGRSCRARPQRGLLAARRVRSPSMRGSRHRACPGRGTAW